MLLDYKLGQGSIILRVKIRNSSVSTGAGLTGLTSASSGLIISTIADNEATATTYTVAGSTIETISTLGTYAAPTATKCRFKEVDSTNHKGVYEIQIADARFAVSSAKSLLISISGATNAAECDVLVPLRSVDPYDSVRFGMTALPNAAAAAAGGLWILGSNNTAAITIGNLTTSAIACTTITASGAVAFQSTFAVSSTVTFNAFTVTNATTLSGAVSLGSTLGVTGTTTLAALTTTGTVTFNALTVSNATTLSGAVSLGSTLGVTGTATFAAITATGTVTFNAFTVSNTMTVGTNAIPWNASWDAEVQSEVDDALVAQNLDHLVKVAVDTDFATTVHVDSVIGQMVQTADGGFSRATDSNEAIRDRGDAAWITATGFSTHSAADVWAVGTRTLTAATNIISGGTLTVNGSGHVILQDGSLVTAKLGTFALAKTTNITGFNDIAATDIVSAGAITTSSGAVTTVTNVTNGVTLAASAITAIWDKATSALTTAGSIGKLLVDNINATISSRSSHSAADVWAVATRTITAITDFALPAEAAGVPTTFLAAVRRIFERGTNKRTRDRGTGIYVLRNAADDDDLETNTQSTSGNVDTISEAA